MMKRERFSVPFKLICSICRFDCVGQTDDQWSPLRTVQADTPKVSSAILHFSLCILNLSQSHSQPVTVSISIPFVSCVLRHIETRAPMKPGTRRQKEIRPIYWLPRIVIRGRASTFESATPIATTMYCAEIVDERRFVGEDSPIIIISTSFVE